MSIPPVSPVSPVNRSQTVQNQPSKSNKPGSTESPTDTVQLSPAALAHLQSGDQDHDGDSK